MDRPIYRKCEYFAPVWGFEGYSRENAFLLKSRFLPLKLRTQYTPDVIKRWTYPDGSVVNFTELNEKLDITPGQCYEINISYRDIESAYQRKRDNTPGWCKVLTFSVEYTHLYGYVNVPLG